MTLCPTLTNQLSTSRIPLETSHQRRWAMTRKHRARPGLIDKAISILASDEYVLLGPMCTQKTDMEGRPNPLGFPGGTPRLGETPCETASREAGQETSIWLPPERYQLLRTVVDGPYRFHICFARVRGVDVEKSLPSHREFLELKWIRFKQIRWDRMLPWARKKLYPILRTAMTRPTH